MLTAFVDLDGVLVDLAVPALAMHGRQLPPREITWDLSGQIGMSREDFWKPMHSSFWETLPWTREGKHLLAAVERFFGDNVAILSAPSPNIATSGGKIEWIRKHLPQYEDRFFIGASKQLFAGPNKLLIDDRDENVSEFIAAGGKAILIPRSWNTNKHLIDDLGGFDAYDVYDQMKAIVYSHKECK